MLLCRLSPPGKVLKIYSYFGCIGDFLYNLEFGHTILCFHAADVGHKHLQNAVPMGEQNMNDTDVNAILYRHLNLSVTMA